ncbi:MAG: DUF5103 domain-containing protein [Prolixibacteraceae bacterium]
MKNIFFLLFLNLLLISQASTGANLPRVLENTVYADNLKTVEMYRDGWKLSNPILTLNNEEQLIFSFDDLDNEQKDYYYTIYHCDRNWRISKIPQQDYLDSFLDFPITDAEYSVNTKVRYINYVLRIPNEDVPLKLSGNYALVVFDRDQPDQPLITWRFYVVEPKVSINARIRRASYDPVNGENQEIDFIIDYGNYPIQDPSADLKVVLTQNNRSDNAITDLKPLYISSGRLEYDYSQENVFKGVNEFRSFEIRGIKYPGEGVAEIGFYDPVYHATLLTDQIRTQKKYASTKDLNGNFYIEAYNQTVPEIEADYLFVHFTLALNQPFLGGGVYVFGSLSNWQCNPQNQMKWNFEKHQYELIMLLKQGYYNFMYAYKNDNESVAKCENLEGSHNETENDYQIYVYHGKITDRYDRLIGCQKFNSLTNRTFIP